MIANYGYTDGSGEYFITIDTSCCVDCSTRDCIPACPQQIFEIITDDYDDPASSVKEAFRNTLKYTCAACKPAGHATTPPCIRACAPDAIRHSW